MKRSATWSCSCAPSASIHDWLDRRFQKKDARPRSDAKSGGGVTRFSMVRARKGARAQGWRESCGGIRFMKLPEEDVERLEPSKVKHVTVLDRIASHLKCRKSGSQRTDCNLA